jgi:TonB family protein
MNSPETMQLGLLPERRLNWRAMAASYGSVALLLLFLVLFGLLFPDRLPLTGRYQVTQLVTTPVSEPKPVKVRVQHQMLEAKVTPPPVFEAPKLVVPPDLRVQKPKLVEAPKVVMDTFKPAVLEQTKAPAPKLLYTGSFGSSAVVMTKAPVEKVQTGGFGDPNGVHSTAKSNAPVNIASLGSFDMPAGAGRGNGTGGANGIRGTVASAGFGNGVAISTGDHRTSAVQTGSFGAQQIAQASAHPRQMEAAATAPVEITYKPDPVYTQEARQLRIEGEVLLQVMFGANGQLHVDRVVRGLGHGLDQAAINAAGKIRFKPATRDGVPVDSTAIVHVTFQLAF